MGLDSQRQPRRLRAGGARAVAAFPAGKRKKANGRSGRLSFSVLAPRGLRLRFRGLFMNESLLKALQEIVARYGLPVLDDPKRVESLLRDLCGEQKREVACLVAAVRARVPQELVGSSAATPSE